MNISIIPGGRLLEDDEHVVARWQTGDGRTLRAEFVRGDEASLQLTAVLVEQPTADVPLEAGVDAVPAAIVEQLGQRGYQIAVPEREPAEDADAETQAGEVGD